MERFTRVAATACRAESGYKKFDDESITTAN
jgi:hypothetical protein